MAGSLVTRTLQGETPENGAQGRLEMLEAKPSSVRVSSVLVAQIARQLPAEIFHRATAAQRCERARQRPGVYFRKVILSTTGPYRKCQVFNSDVELRFDCFLPRGETRSD